MPTYAYACKECGHRFDAVQSFADPTLTACPVCGGALKKEYGSIGVTFNGSGFYRTDSRAPATGGDSGSSGDGASGGGAKSDGGSAAPAGGEKQVSASSSRPAPSAPAPSGT